MKRLHWAALVTLVAALGLAIAAVPTWAGAKKSYEQINWTNQADRERIGSQSTSFRKGGRRR